MSGVATVYYEIDGSSGDVTNINNAITQFNSDFPGVIQWVDNTSLGSPSPNYVLINLSTSDTSGVCEANVGYDAMPAQPVSGSANCDEATILHEMGHVIGLWHEMTRTDRDTYVTVNYNNVTKSDYPGNFLINTENQQLLTKYFDYGSLMQYGAADFSRNNGPVIESIPAGIPMNIEGLPAPGPNTSPEPADYSAADKEGILRLYGAPPTAVTITSNPAGLQVIVDSTTYTTPHTFPLTGAWAMGTTHTLDVPTGVQQLSGYIIDSTAAASFYYTYGRWNDSTAQQHTITITAGDGSPGFPRTSPEVTTYTANFIQLVPYTATADPTGSGTISSSPQPQAYSDTNNNPLGNFFVARQNVTLTATANSGWNFYWFNNAPFWLPGGLSTNPKELFVPDTGTPINSTIYFSPSSNPLYIVNVTPSETLANQFALNWYADVDGSYWLAPKTFSPNYWSDGTTWTTGSTHTLSIASPMYVGSNTRYVFNNWSDGGALSHTTGPLPATNATYTATFDPQFAPSTGVNASCGGSVTISQTSPTGDGFYPWGQTLTFTATPNPGWNFTGWSYDLAGGSNPDTITADDETLAYANFNTTTDPFAFTGISPASVQAGTNGTTLILTGTGFDAANSYVFLGNTQLATTFRSSTELDATVTPAELANPATYPIYIENFPSGATCAAFGGQTFKVTAPPVTPTISWTPAGTIIFGDAGTKVLTAIANAPGAFTYSATQGGAPINVTSGTQGLAAGSWNITATFTPTDPTTYATAQTTLAITVSGESVWILNSGGSGAELAGDGYGISTSAYPGANTAIAIDSGGNVWTAGTGPLLEETSQVGTVQNTISSGGGLNAPAGIAIDGLSQVWVTDGNNSVSQFSNAGAPVSPSTGYTDTSLATPIGIAIDQAGSVWVANKGNNSLTRILGAAAPAAPLSTAAKNNTTGARP
ncbi:MAG: M12 family metallopeptidase [Acidobacteriota bacterium]